MVAVREELGWDGLMERKLESRSVTAGSALVVKLKLEWKVIINILLRQ